MSQDKLSALALLTIEQEVRKLLDMELLITKYAEKKTQEVKF